MKIFRLDNMKRGWFVGEFNPTVAATKACEVAVKHYSAGETESSHYHKIATEITTVISGTVRMFDQEFHESDIIVAEPNDVTDFMAITNAVTVCVKLPCVLGDKFEA